MALARPPPMPANIYCKFYPISNSWMVFRVIHSAAEIPKQGSTSDLFQQQEDPRLRVSPWQDRVTKSRLARLKSQKLPRPRSALRSYFDSSLPKRQRVRVALRPTDMHTNNHIYVYLYMHIYNTMRTIFSNDERVESCMQLLLYMLL